MNGGPSAESRLRRRETRTLLLFVIGGIALWGIYLSIGAWRGDRMRDRDLVRGLFVGVCFAGFLGLWVLGLLMKAKQRRRAPAVEEGTQEEQLAE